MSYPEFSIGAARYSGEQTDAALERGETVLWELIADQTLGTGTFVKITDLETGDSSLKHFPKEYIQMDLGL